ncbi:hypothetical protein AB0O67_20395 [Streptomyces sp. NPDC086077]|uniref:hypothetical protein n=1 Tax=Streptomyces sp. NPDC086077 TaxID=3154862 RepID=UPI003444C0AB
MTATDAHDDLRHLLNEWDPIGVADEDNRSDANRFGHWAGRRLPCGTTGRILFLDSARRSGFAADGAE